MSCMESSYSRVQPFVAVTVFSIDSLGRWATLGQSKVWMKHGQPLQLTKNRFLRTKTHNNLCEIGYCWWKKSCTTWNNGITHHPLWCRISAINSSKSSGRIAVDDNGLVSQRSQGPHAWHAAPIKFHAASNPADWKFELVDTKFWWSTNVSGQNEDISPNHTKSNSKTVSFRTCSSHKLWFAVIPPDVTQIWFQHSVGHLCEGPEQRTRIACFCWYSNDWKRITTDRSDVGINAVLDW